MDYIRNLVYLQEIHTFACICSVVKNVETVYALRKQLMMKEMEICDVVATLCIYICRYVKSIILTKHKRNEIFIIHYQYNNDIRQC